VSCRRCTPLAVMDVDVDVVVVLAARVGEHGAVRRPGGALVVDVVVGELGRVRAVGVHHPDLLVAPGCRRDVRRRTRTRSACRPVTRRAGVERARHVEQRASGRCRRPPSSRWRGPCRRTGDVVRGEQEPAHVGREARIELRARWIESCSGDSPWRPMCQMPRRGPGRCGGTGSRCGRGTRPAGSRPAVRAERQPHAVPAGRGHPRHPRS
jgi:hypothetical protein